NSGLTAGGTAVTITGTNFTYGGSLNVTIGVLNATNVCVASDTTITATTPANIAGTFDVIITNNDGQIVTREGAFTYVYPPTFTSISPNSGSTAGGTAVTITGTNFTEGSCFVYFGGENARVGYNDATTIRATTPAHVAGYVDVLISNLDYQQSVTANNAFYYFEPIPVAPAGGGGSNTNIGVGASQDLNAGDTASFGFEGKGAVDGLSVKVNQDTPSLMVTVTEHSSPPSSVDAPDTDVYKFEEVKTYHADPSAISGGIFEFTVPKSWLDLKGHTFRDIVMLHRGGVWATLPTKFVREEGRNLYFTAETLSFSWFAIGIGEGETILPEETPEVTAVQTDAPAVNEIITVAETTPPVSTEAAAPAESQSSLLMPVILGIVIILLIIIGAGLWQRRQKSKYPEWWDKKL
ncbi:MAG: IPT/TIG domain-containing protein, partial [Methanomicrobium sp.]|nr:IPT/TIG domain-containing protein [Methanomicrobium sp.]